MLISSVFKVSKKKGRFVKNRKAGGLFIIVVGVILVIAALIWGITGSHHVDYQNSQDNVTYHIGEGTSSNNVYIHADGSLEYFVALSGDFTPSISQSDIDNSTSISFIARTDTTDINLDANGTTIKQAHKIEKLVFYDKNDKVMATYTTNEYKANPNGVAANTWPQAIGLGLLGLLLLLGGIVNIARQPKTSFSIGGPAQPYQPGVPPNAPTYPPNAYNAGAGAPPYQPGAPAYPPNQPANPYGQPYQGAEQYPQPNNPYQQPPRY